MAAKKYYAVRNGRTPGIYDTWEECKANVDGYSGAVYKSFRTRAEACAYIGIAVDDTDSDVKQGESLEEYLKSQMVSQAICYVDGSYNVATHEYAYGMVLYDGSALYEDKGSYYDEELSSMRNVAGELDGAIHAMRYCLEHSITSLDLYYDYLGIENWALGVWKAGKPGTIAYKKYYDKIKGRLNVHFHKVKGHSGDIGNDRADELAKSALGM